MNVKHPQVVLNSLSIKNIFYDEMDLKLWRRSGVFLLTLNIQCTPCSSVSIVNFEKVTADWEYSTFFVNANEQSHLTLS